MAIPPQFLKHVKGKQDSAAKDAKESPAQHKKDLASGKDKPGPGDPGFKGKSKSSSKKAPFDAIPSGPMKGQNPNASKAKRDQLLTQMRGK